MVDIQSKEVIDKISDDLKIQPALLIPRVLGKDIQLSYNVNPDREVRVETGGGADGTSHGIFTTSTTKDTFLIGGYLSVSKDASSNAINSSLLVTPEGKAEIEIILIAYEPSTAGNHKQEIILPKPIKLERGVIVRVANNSGTASIDVFGIAYFYETDPQ